MRSVMKAFFIAIVAALLAGIGFAEEAGCLRKSDMPKRLLDSSETANAEMLLFVNSQFGETALFFGRKNGGFFVRKISRPQRENVRGAMPLPRNAYEAIQKIATLEVAAASKSVKLGLDGHYAGAAVKTGGTWACAEGWAHNNPPYLRHFKLFRLAEAVSRAINAKAGENSAEEILRLTDEFYKIDRFYGKSGFLNELAEMLGLRNPATIAELESLCEEPKGEFEMPMSAENLPQKFPQICKLRPVEILIRQGDAVVVLPWKCPAMNAGESVKIIVAPEDVNAEMGTTKPNCAESLKLSPRIWLVVGSGSPEDSICRNRSRTHSWESRNSRKKRKVLPLRRRVRLSLR